MVPCVRMSGLYAGTVALHVHICGAEGGCARHSDDTRCVVSLPLAGHYMLYGK